MMIIILGLSTFKGRPRTLLAIIKALRSLKFRNESIIDRITLCLKVILSLIITLEIMVEVPRIDTITSSYLINLQIIGASSGRSTEVSSSNKIASNVRVIYVNYNYYTNTVSL